VFKQTTKGRKHGSKEKTMNNRLIGLAVACVVFPAMLIAQPVENRDLTGVWVLKVRPHDAPRTLLVLGIFSEDGSYTCSSDQKLPPVPAIQAVGTEMGPCQGRWARTGAREFRLTFYAVIWKEGVVNGFHRLQSTITLSENGDEFTAHGEADFLDSNWNVVFSTTTDGKGTRLKTPSRLETPDRS
jgi:hypothetical protein